MIIRRATRADREAIIAVSYDTFESTWRPELTQDAVRAFRAQDRPRQYATKRGELFWVAERDDAVIGFVDWDGDFVNALHIRSEHARTGAGTALMNKAEAEIAGAGHAQARLETDTFNQRAQAFYAARGFVEVGRYPDTEWSSGLTTLLLVKTFVSL